MAVGNKYGLGRDIDEGTKRIVRQRSGFGCVLCGLAFYQYHHVDPPYAEARLHNPDGITLLCGSCHDQVTRGVISDDTVRRAMHNPTCLQKGYSFGCFDMGPTFPPIQFANNTFISDGDFTLIEVNDVDLFRLSSPEQTGGPYRLSASFFDRDEKPTLTIDENEWQVSAGTWDVKVAGRTITVYRSPGHVALQLTNIPHERVIVSRIDMQYSGYEICGSESSSLRVPGLDVQGCTFRVMGAGKKVGIHLGR